MSTALQAVIAEPAAPTEPIAPAAESSRFDRIHRLSIDRYNRMVDAGIFGGKEPIFLWKGRLVEKMTKNLPTMSPSLSSPVCSSG